MASRKNVKNTKMFARKNAKAQKKENLEIDNDNQDILMLLRPGVAGRRLA